MRKIIPLFCILAVSLCHANAQDTVRWGDGSIYMVPPIVKDSLYYFHQTDWGGYFRVPPEYPGEHEPGMKGCLFVAETNTHIYGIAIYIPSISVYSHPVNVTADGLFLYDGWENGDKDSALWVIVIRKRHEGGQDYYDRVDSAIWYPHSASRIIELQTHCPAYPDDTTKMYVPTHELYFDQPLTLQDSFYVCIRPTYGWEISPNVSRPYIGCRIPYTYVLFSAGGPYRMGIVG